MKRIIIVVICALGMFACSEKRPSVVEHPVFDVWNSGTLEINKIELSDTATVFYFDAFFRPKQWIKIAKETYIRESGGEEKLTVVKSEGITLDEEFFMPESGETSFKLYFPPLKPGITKIDFIESDCDGCFKTWGIQLSSKAKVEFETPVSKLADKAGQPLPEPVFSTKKTVIKGRFLGYVKDLNMKFECHARDIFSANSEVPSVSVADDGSFSGEFPLNFPQVVRTSAGDLFLVPGETQEVYIDLRKKSRRQSRFRPDKEPSDTAEVYIFGSYLNPSEIKQLYANKRVELVSSDTLFKKILNMNPEQFKEYMIAAHDKKVAEIPDGFSDNLKRLVKVTLNDNLFQMLMQYEAIRRYACRQAGMEDEVPKPLEIGYYSFLNKAADKDMAYSNYNALLRLAKTDIFSLPDKPVKEQFAYFKDKVSQLLNIQQNETALELVHASLYANRIKQMNFFSDADKQEIGSAINNKDMIESLIAENDRVYKEVGSFKDSKESVVNDAPAVDESKMFDAIMSKYKGKVVLVDFWATWCGPCVYANKEIKPYKETMKGKDVVFLYLTGETSPMLNWRKMIPDIHGEHYRVSDKQWAYWRSAFSIEGVPTLFVYDKTGKQTYKTTGFPGVDAVKKEIEKNL